MKRKAIAAVVIGEGITEKYFFDSLRDILKIKPKAEIQKHTSIQYLEKEIKKCIQLGYDKIYCLIDMDNKDSKEIHRKNSESYLQLKKKYHNKKFNSKEGESEVIFFESSPSIELFFLYYFGFKGAEFSNTQLKDLLKEMTGYKTELNFLKNNPLHQFFESKGGSLTTAISASEQSLLNKDANRPGASYTEIGRLIKQLL